MLQIPELIISGRFYREHERPAWRSSRNQAKFKSPATNRFQTGRRETKPNFSTRSEPVSLLTQLSCITVCFLSFSVFKRCVDNCSETSLLFFPRKSFFRKPAQENVVVFTRQSEERLVSTLNAAATSISSRRRIQTSFLYPLLRGYEVIRPSFHLRIDEL